MNDLDRDVEMVRRELERQNYALGGHDKPTILALAALDRLVARIKTLEQGARDAMLRVPALGEQHVLCKADRIHLETRVRQLEAEAAARNALSRTNDTPPQHKEVEEA